MPLSDLVRFVTATMMIGYVPQQGPYPTLTDVGHTGATSFSSGWLKCSTSTGVVGESGSGNMRLVRTDLKIESSS